MKQSVLYGEFQTSLFEKMQEFRELVEFGKSKWWHVLHFDKDTEKKPSFSHKYLISLHSTLPLSFRTFFAFLFPVDYFKTFCSV